ncbi:MAG: hypothetical protein AAB925_01770 [Patescibacteria group bacterium]
MKDSSLTIRICDWIVKYSIYVLVFLLPLLFLPWTSEILDFNKQTLLIILVFVSLFSWMLKVLISGKLEASVNKVYIFIGIFFLACLFSTIFSIDKYGSFWGWPGVTSESLLSIIGFVFLYFIVSNAFSKKEIVKSIYVFSISALIAEIYGALQLFGKSPAFNTIGSAGGLGIFAAVLLPLIFVLLISAKKWWKILFIAEIFLSAIILVLINYPVVWWIAALGSAIFIICGVFKRNLFDGRWMALPMFFLVVSLFFIILNPQINWLQKKTNEISLSKQANFQIDAQALKENPVFGSGLGTFFYNFSKFKNSDFSKTILWNVSFTSGSSKILTVLATAGFVGILAFLAFIFAVIVSAGRFIFTEDGDVLALGLLASLAAEIASFFFHNTSLPLDFLFFFLAAGAAGVTIGRKKEYELKPSSLLTLVITFIFTLAFIFGVGILILNSQRYAAEASYYSGLKFLEAGKLDDGIKNLEKAVSLNSAADLYFRQLSQVYFLKIQDVLSNKTMSEDDKTKNIQTLLANSVNAAKISTDINPKNAGNWLARGHIYQNLTGLIADSDTWAISSYDEALKLDPNNPYSLAQKGIVYFQKKDYQNAKINFDKALELKPDYQNAIDGKKALDELSQIKF